MTVPDTSRASDSQVAQAIPRTGLEAMDEMLAAQFDATHHDVRGGVAIEYLTGEQVIFATARGARYMRLELSDSAA